MIRTYNTIPKKIEAVQWRGTNEDELLKLLNNNRYCKHRIVYEVEVPDIHKTSPTLVYIPKSLETKKD